MQVKKDGSVEVKRTTLDILEEILSAISIIFLVTGLSAFQLLEYVNDKLINTLYI